MAKTWNQRFVELTVEEMKKSNIHLVTPGNIDRSLKGKDNAKLRIYPVTIVNLLGKYGDFETDSNGDGLADGWSKTGSNQNVYSLDNGIVSSKSQKMVLNPYTNNGGGTDYNLIWYSVPVSNGEIYLMGVYAKTNGESAIVNYCDITDGDQSQSAVGAKTVTSTTWKKYISKVQVLYNNTKLDVKYITKNVVSGDDVSNEIDLWVDGAFAYNLTAMGTLPPPIQEIYGVTNWSDLDENTLAELLPFVNGIATLGFTWAGDL